MHHPQTKNTSQTTHTHFPIQVRRLRDLQRAANRTEWPTEYLWQTVGRTWRRCGGSDTRRHADGNGQSEVHQRPAQRQSQVQRILPRSGDDCATGGTLWRV